jgi:two-component system nitrate/nitrite response regulator NarL
MQSDVTSSERPRVLLVDDNAAMLSRAASVLEPACAIVGTANDGAGALAAAKNLHPDVIVLDISMPGISGLEVAHTLRQSGSEAAVVFLTVHDDEEFVLAAQMAGAIGYVIKARVATDLMRAVQEAREGRPFVSPMR